MTEQSRQRLGYDMALFVARLEALGVQSLGDVDESTVREFIDEPVPARSGGFMDPKVATRHTRRAAVRLFFRVARGLGLCSHDPTLDIVLPPRTSQRARALSDDEILIAESAAAHTLTSTRLPAAFALAEATAVTSEIAAATVEDVDLDGGRVWLHGGSKRVARWGELTSWGVDAVARRIADLGSDPTIPLIYGAQSSTKSGQAATCDAVLVVLRRSGLGTDRDVRPTSVAAWAGTKVYERRGRIDDVAIALGLRSLDRAAEIIGWDWPSR